MVTKEGDSTTEIRLIGCCGDYCKTFPAYKEDYFMGCKLECDTSEGTLMIPNAKGMCVASGGKTLKPVQIVENTHHARLCLIFIVKIGI